MVEGATAAATAVEEGAVESAQGGAAAAAGVADGNHQPFPLLSLPDTVLSHIAGFWGAYEKTHVGLCSKGCLRLALRASKRVVVSLHNLPTAQESRAAAAAAGRLMEGALTPDCNFELCLVGRGGPWTMVFLEHCSLAATRVDNLFLR